MADTLNGSRDYPKGSDQGKLNKGLLNNRDASQICWALRDSNTGGTRKLRFRE